MPCRVTENRKKKPRKFKSGRKRNEWRAYFYANNQRTYLGSYPTYEEALAVEERERLRRQRELLVDFPEEVRHHRQQRLFNP